MDKEKIKKDRTKLKENALKILHVICYILSGLFLLCLLVSGLQSCNATSVSAEAPQTHIENLTNSSWVFKDELDINETEDYTINFVNLNQDEFDVIRFDSTANTLKYYNSTSGATEWAWDEEDKWIYTEVDKTITITGGDSVTNTTLIEWFYANATITNDFLKFTINKSFNFNAMFGGTMSERYGGTLSMAQSLGSDNYAIILNTGRFISNGVIYDALVFTFTDADKVFFSLDGQVVNGEAGYLSYRSLGYRKAGTLLDYDLVNLRDIGQGTLGPNALVSVSYYKQSSTWVNDAYRYIEFLQPLAHETKVQLNALNNNYQFNGIDVLGNEDNNVFVLIGSAFSSWVPLLSVALLPGITIGTLVFIPLVVGIIFAIIKMIKK